jgi:transmembrane sensor
MMLAGVAIAALLYLRDPTYSTEIGEQRAISLADGTRIVLNTQSRLAVHFTAHERRVRVDAGEAFFDVAKNAERPFIVTAGEESVTALGTAFLIRRKADSIDVTLVEGRVRVSATAEAHVATDASRVRVLSPGQRLRVAGAVSTLDQPDVEVITAWRRGEIVLDHTPLAEAVADLNRYSPVPIEIASPEAAALRVSGIFRAGDSAQFARAIADTYQLEVSETPERIVLTGAPHRPGL